MPKVEYWLDEYARDHQNPVNKALHTVCVPLIVVSLIALLWSMPVPAAFAAVSPWLNWGTAMLALAISYYLTLSMPLSLGMLPVMLVVILIVNWMDTLAPPLWMLAGIVFIAAWVGQFAGHMVEGKRPAFFRDIQFLMIGPLWLLASLYRRVGITY